MARAAAAVWRYRRRTPSGARRKHLYWRRGHGRDRFRARRRRGASRREACRGAATRNRVCPSATLRVRPPRNRAARSAGFGEGAARRHDAQPSRRRRSRGGEAFVTRWRQRFELSLDTWRDRLLENRSRPTAEFATAPSSSDRDPFHSGRLNGRLPFEDRLPASAAVSRNGDGVIAFLVRNLEQVCRNEIW